MVKRLLMALWRSFTPAYKLKSSVEKICNTKWTAPKRHTSVAFLAGGEIETDYLHTETSG
jgi:hypothetical protein